MNITLELVRYLIILFIGIISIKWFEWKKGWQNSLGISLIFILSWKTMMLLLLIIMNILLDLFLLDFFMRVYELYVVYPIMLVFISFFVNIFLGVTFFKLVYNHKIQESIVIVLIIVIIEMILESILIYSTIIPEFLFT